MLRINKNCDLNNFHYLNKTGFLEENTVKDILIMN